MTPELVKDIAENAARAAAKEAVREMLIALGINPERLPEEQQVWSFARTLHQGTRRGALALFTGFLSTLAALLATAIWYIFSKH